MTPVILFEVVSHTFILSIN